MQPFRYKCKQGFTLAELLIALAILGVIATFTIPKVLQAQQNTSYRAEYKEAMGAISQAYQLYKLQNQASGATSTSDLTPYLNYVAVTTSATIDAGPTDGSRNCGTAHMLCLVLHNGAILQSEDWITFGQTNTTNFISYTFDPDGKSDPGVVDGLTIDLYFNGHVASGVERLAGSTLYYNGAPAVWGADFTPSWFSWN